MAACFPGLLARFRGRSALIRQRTKLFATPQLREWRRAPVYGYFRSFSSRADDDVKIPMPEIPKEKLDIKFVKSSAGPGGQNVNKLNTKAEVRFKPKEADWIPKLMLDRFLELHSSKLNKEGEFVITSIRHRLQAQNLKDCLEKLREYLEEASFIPKERIPTDMPQYAIEKRLYVRQIDVYPGFELLFTRLCFA